MWIGYLLGTRGKGDPEVGKWGCVCTLSSGAFEKDNTMSISKTIGGLATIGILAFSANAETISAGYGWEDGNGTILGSFGNLASAENVSGFANTGNHSLMLTEDPVSGTPQAYLGWVTGLSEGDSIFASLFAFSPSDGASIRIWGNYTSDVNDINSYDGSAGGENTYPDKDEWFELEKGWTFNSAGGDHTGLVIVARMYSGTNDHPGTYAFVDDLWIEVSGDDLSGVEIHFAPAPGAIALLGLAGLAGTRRSR